MIYNFTDSENVNDFLKSAYRNFEIDYPKFFKMDAISKLALITSEILLKELDLKSKYESDELAMVFANSVSSLNTDKEYYKTTFEVASPALFVYTLPNILVGEICIKNKIKGENAFFIFDTFADNFLLDYAKGLVNYGYSKACVIGWVDLDSEKYTASMWFFDRENFDTECLN